MSRRPDPRPPAPLRLLARRLLVFGVTLGGFYALTALPAYRQGLFPAYLRANAGASAWLLRLLGEEARAEGILVITPHFQLAIQRGCEALEPAALLLAAVLASPGTWRQRLWGAALGVPLLLAANLVRVVSLYYTGVHAPEAFEFVHLDLWQPGFVLLTLGLWGLWLMRVRRQA